MNRETLTIFEKKNIQYLKSQTQTKHRKMNITIYITFQIIFLQFHFQKNHIDNKT